MTLPLYVFCVDPSSAGEPLYMEYKDDFQRNAPAGVPLADAAVFDHDEMEDYARAFPKWLNGPRGFVELPADIHQFVELWKS